MASRALLCSLRLARVQSSHGARLSFTRTYVTPVRTWTPPNPPIKSQKALASTGTGVAGTGNPTIVDSLPSTSSEVKVPNNGNGNAYGNDNGNGNGNGFGLELGLDGQQAGTDWSKSYHGLSTQAFAKEIVEVLLAPIDPLDVEMKPGASSLHLLCPFYGVIIKLLLLIWAWLRRPGLPSRNKIPTHTQQSIRAWRVGPCTPQRD